MFSSGDHKSRQSSGGKGFFSRRKDKSAESKVYEEESSHLHAANGPPSVGGSQSSRHSRKHSEPFDQEQGLDGNGLSMTAGVITSIPYDSVSASNKTPVPVEYLPRHDQAQNQHHARNDLQPHHLNKSGIDFHQYPTWEPTKMPGGPAGPRQQPGSSQTSLLRERQPKATINGNAPQTHSYSTADSSNARNSFDQVSIYSTVSSNTGRSSIFSSENTSRPALPPHMHPDNNSLRPSSSHSSVRQSTASNWHHTPQYNTAATFTPDGFNLSRPADDAVVEEQFIALMHKRGWQHIPDQSRRQMLAYPASKKWTLIHQDKLTDWQDEQKRRQNARTTLLGNDGVPGILSKADEEGTPEWYVKRILDDTITAKQLQSLSVSLRTQPIK
ncbi:MAG: hypothetical protein LQ340_002215 [Diploschistes diacapsis]|nr:MAG: hypothetical protein LQ340_002215 [Diploschistes diacapsis]